MDNTKQASVRHSNWASYLIDRAKVHIPTAGGGHYSKNRFFEVAAGEKATRVLKGLGLYERYKNEYEEAHGEPVPEVFAVDVPEEETVHIDPLVDDL